MLSFSSMRWTPLVLLLLRPGLCLAADAVADELASLAALWQERADAAKAEEGMRLATTALAARPDDAERMFWLARFELWAGEGASAPSEKKRLGQQAWAVADRLARARPDWVAGHYFRAAAIGLYCQGTGLFSALSEGLDSKFNERLERALALDPRFERNGPRLAKGRYYFEMPWPKGSLGKSAEWYRQALADDPNNLRAMTWLAETLWREGDIAGARVQLARARDGHIAGDPA